MLDVRKAHARDFAATDEERALSVEREAQRLRLLLVLKLQWRRELAPSNDLDLDDENDWGCEETQPAAPFEAMPTPNERPLRRVG